jgi:hypothetical protein
MRSWPWQCPLHRLLVVAGALLPTLAGANPRYERLPIDGAPADTVALDRRGRAAIAGWGGLFTSLDGGQSWRRRPEVDPQALGCGEMALSVTGDEVVFLCILPRAPRPYCARVGFSAGYKACEGAGEGGAAIARMQAAQRKEGERCRQRLGIGKGTRLVAAAAGSLVLVGHERLGVYRSEDGGRRFDLSVAGMDGLAAVDLRGGGQELRVLLASPSWVMGVHGEGPYAKAGEATCELPREPAEAPRCQVQPAEALTQAGAFFPAKVTAKAAPEHLSRPLGGLGLPPGAALHAFWPMAPADGARPVVVGTSRGAFLLTP